LLLVDFCIIVTFVPAYILYWSLLGPDGEVTA